MTAATRNTIIGLVAVVAIGGGIYYYKKTMMPAEQVAIDTEVISEEGNATTAESTINEAAAATSSAASTGVNTATASADESLDSQRFNNAMTNARIAVGQKDYRVALKQYNLALKYQNVDTVYIGLYVVYGAQGNWTEARKNLDKAIALAPTNADYWRWKLTLLDEKTDTPYEALVSLYDDGMKKVDTAYKVNLVTQFARVAEYNGRINDAIAQWELAKTIIPEYKAMYQSEIDRLKTMQ
ncbi:MAG: hypothetical protein KBC67_02185 [Candidatus Pacebacteria bacterium]|jgi:tetratricopeptide (TPR) repeat protein|nr:hypothetical protein [Candidatus Paceibacterota bacterium]